MNNLFILIRTQQPFVSSVVEKHWHAASGFSTSLEANGGGE
ncbi:hypothetical protein [Sphingobium sp. GW456-12-10-14-TSB1]|nr:hypothetical protein [Sphingobium sp. GW456-12-10-14-TSB1]